LWYRRVLEIEPHDPVGLNNLASVLLARGFCDDASEIVADALAMQSGDSPYLEMLRATEAESLACGTTPQRFPAH
jgi:Flp pilus assembly protein TadD